MSTTITSDNLQRITFTDMREAAEIALKEGRPVEFHSRSTETGAPCHTLVVDNSEAGQCQGGNTAWGDWEPKTQTLKIDGERVDLNGKPVD
ncbi:hypothetical protein FJV41_31215 [Myxococcus llanfairpwllgwyngyllgogerychwyrndrobwllllantysiliogogogochensis]|uniref:Uncharacterized protein n=1 Tax=Myxococcus llanfairpwllgwyngyllgogerychwyrndrobwllllantysiliogogogochensis TaxID=2590453 RepID=A0A540WSJ5_9BACT|nr:hypothetical protein [Myxococcus llanfairpwllgwyngyllgogerychwyrndrobwllllantysiliogogogochensis]TQF11998.1 hypothetical protein FJV41_31215 [Myxococcus llanfairpwllgwyngyllgogerychwyrndrobwllllantysiliogogogochensis]